MGQAIGARAKLFRFPEQNPRPGGQFFRAPVLEFSTRYVGRVRFSNQKRVLSANGSLSRRLPNMQPGRVLWELRAERERVKKAIVVLEGLAEARGIARKGRAPGQMADRKFDASDESKAVNVPFLVVASTLR